ncbi:hypothetical protein BC828DRAFT_384799 [Blastocladiella britannica]|nr:hypothetical protein BC828DRAFT_384799 [Blastocladiella britannica]
MTAREWLAAHASLADARAALFADHPTIPMLDPAATELQHGRLVQFRAMVQDTSLPPQIYPLLYRDGSTNQVHASVLDDTVPAAVMANPARAVVRYADRTPVYLVSVPGELSINSTTTTTPGADPAKFPLPSRHPHVAVIAKWYLGRLSWAADAAANNGDNEDGEPALALGAIVRVTGILDVPPASDENDDGLPPTLHVISHSVEIAHSMFTGSTATTSSSPTDLRAARNMLVAELASTAFEGDQLAALLFLAHTVAPPSAAVGGQKQRGLTGSVADEEPWPHHLPLVIPGLLIPTDNGKDVDATAWTGRVRVALRGMAPVVHVPLSPDSLMHDRWTPASVAVTAAAAPDSAHHVDESADPYAIADAEDLYDDAGVASGWLQLAHGSVLVLNEETMREGQLPSHAVTNLASLSRVLTSHTLEYAFPYTSVSLPTGYSAVIAARSARGLLPRGGVVVPLEPPAVIAPLDPAASGPIIDAYVAKLAAWSRSGRSPATVVLPADKPEFLAEIEAAYVADRLHAHHHQSEAQGATTGSDGSQLASKPEQPHALEVPGPALLHWHLALARRLAWMAGEAEVTRDAWDEARALDAARLARVRLMRGGDTAAATIPAGPVEGR